jgi:hypothetical protein
MSSEAAAASSSVKQVPLNDEMMSSEELEEDLNLQD